MSIVPGESACAYVSGVPHAGQKLRVTGGVLWNDAGVPFTKWKLAMGKVAQATTGAPATRRQVRQWHTIVLEGRPSHS